MLYTVQHIIACKPLGHGSTLNHVIMHFNKFNDWTWSHDKRFPRIHNDPHSWMTMPGDCVDALMLYIIRERPQKNILYPSCITNTTYDCKPGLSVLSIYGSMKTKIKPSMGTVSWWSASLISCKWLDNTVLQKIFGDFSGLYPQR